MKDCLPANISQGSVVEGLKITSDKIANAYNIGVKLFDGKCRKSGEPYFFHCTEVARILQQEWGVTNEDVLAAALLHDSVEDTHYTIDDVRRDFGNTVADLVNGVTNLSNASDHHTVKHVLGEDTIDLGVAIIKLSDRLHNMRTLDSMAPAKQVAKSEETMSVYTRLAESLGIWQAKIELEDLSFKYLEPEKYQQIFSELKQDPRRQELFAAHIKSKLTASLQHSQVGNNIRLEPVGYWSIIDKHQKRAAQGECQPDSLLELEDVAHFKIIVGNLDVCYQSVGIIHQLFDGAVDFNSFNEFLGRNSRENGYQAIETTIHSPQGDFKISVLTRQMDEYNRYGAISLVNNGEYKNKNHDLIYVFTSSGRIRFLPQGATGVDFAAQISPSVLADAVSIRINGVESSLSSVVPNGADLEVVTAEPRIAPIADVENYCLLPQTRKAIARLRVAEKGENKILIGKQMIEPIISRLGVLDLNDIDRSVINPVLYKLGCGRPSDLYFKIGFGSKTIADLENALSIYNINRQSLKLSTIRLQGKDHPGILIKLLAKIDKTGKNIYHLGHDKDGNNFEVRVVIQGLTEKQFLKLCKSVKKDFASDTIVVTNT